MRTWIFELKMLLLLMAGVFSTGCAQTIDSPAPAAEVKIAEVKKNWSSNAMGTNYHFAVTVQVNGQQRTLSATPSSNYGASELVGSYWTDLEVACHDFNCASFAILITSSPEIPGSSAAVDMPTSQIAVLYRDRGNYLQVQDVKYGTGQFISAYNTFTSL